MLPNGIEAVSWICGIFQIAGGCIGLGYRSLIVSKEDLLGIYLGETVMPWISCWLCEGLCDALYKLFRY